MREYDVKETAKLIRETLKLAYPEVKFSVKLSRYSGGCSIDATWTDGPTSEQVKPILDAFNGKYFDGMDDSTHYCGKRMYRGEHVNFYSGYVKGSRRESKALLTAVAARVARECGVEPPPINEHAGLSGWAYIDGGHNLRVPFQWHLFWNDNKPLTACDILSDRLLLCHDSHENGGEYLSSLIDRIASNVRLKSALPVELPQYIAEEKPSVNAATVAMGTVETVQ